MVFDRKPKGLPWNWEHMSTTRMQAGIIAVGVQKQETSFAAHEKDAATCTAGNVSGAIWARKRSLTSSKMTAGCVLLVTLPQ